MLESVPVRAGLLPGNPSPGGRQKTPESGLALHARGEYVAWRTHKAETSMFRRVLPEPSWPQRTSDVQQPAPCSSGCWRNWNHVARSNPDSSKAPCGLQTWMELLYLNSARLYISSTS